MKITKGQLRRIIKEELGRQVLRESMDEKTKIADAVLSTEDPQVISSLLDRAVAPGYVERLTSEVEPSRYPEAPYPKTTHTWSFYADLEMAELLADRYESGDLPWGLKVTSFDANWGKPKGEPLESVRPVTITLLVKEY